MKLEMRLWPPQIIFPISINKFMLVIMEEFVWLNDDLIPLAQARVPVNDRGFLYGDGLFETLRADDGRVQFLAEHLERLAASARAFRLPFPANVP
jgi:branched-chain amino acid aminotransferase/para-aminobenzoate synthetase component 1